jgi:hypothetical protein
LGGMGDLFGFLGRRPEIEFSFWRVSSWRREFFWWTLSEGNIGSWAILAGCLSFSAASGKSSRIVAAAEIHETEREQEIGWGSKVLEFCELRWTEGLCSRV